MPIYLPATRRRFLQAAGAGIASAGVFAAARERDGADERLVYLLNDTHVGEKHPPDSAVPTHLRLAVREIVSLPRPPACVLINGDLALKDGQPGDYRHFARLLAPLRDAGVDVHLTLGNHDHRDVFYDVLRSERPESPAVAARHVSVVRTPLACFFLLDSLQQTMVTPGRIGAEQLKWLAEALDANQDRAAIVVAHHNPRLGGDPLHYPGGLIDSPDLWQLLARRPHVKAYVHGHVHDRTLAQHEKIHIINTPATSYVADPKQSTTGWTVARLHPDRVSLTTRCTADDHPWHDQTVSLRWRPEIGAAWRLRVLSYNIHHGAGVDGKLDLTRIARVMQAAEPDLVALQEVDRGTRRSGMQDQAAILAQLTGWHMAFGKNIDFEGGAYGNAVLSRHPITRNENHLLPRLDDGEQRGVLDVTVRIPGADEEVRLLATHLDHRPSDRERLASARRINELAAASELPTLLAGDLNDVPDSPTLRELGRRWTPSNDEPRPTVPVSRPQRQIDFVLHGVSDRWTPVATEVLDESVASDHRAVLAVLELAAVKARAPARQPAAR